MVIDTTSGNIFPPATGFVSTGTIDLGGNGTGKRGIIITGGNTFYGAITLTNLTAITVTGARVTTAVLGHDRAGRQLRRLPSGAGHQGHQQHPVGGGGIIQNASANSTAVQQHHGATWTAR